MISCKKQRQTCIQDVCLNTARRAGRICSVEGAKDCRSFNARHTRRHKFIVLLLAMAIIKGLHSQTYTTITQVRSASEDDGKHTSWHNHTLPWNILCFVTINPKKALRSRLKWRYLGLYYPRAEWGHCIGGAKATMFNARRMWHIKPDNSELIEPTTKFFNAGIFSKMGRQWSILDQDVDWL